MEKQLRTFKTVRTEDISGVSGTGVVAEGVVFTDGTAVLRWLTDKSSTAIYDSIEDLESIHGHGGATRIEYDDTNYYYASGTTQPHPADKFRS